MSKSIDTSAFALTYMDYDESNYSSLFCQKLENLFNTLLQVDSLKQDSVPVHIIESPRKHFRQRCRFAVEHSLITHENGDSFQFVLWESGSASVVVQSFPISSIQIFAIMPLLRDLISQSPDLKDDLRAINFLSSKAGELIFTLIYQRNIGSSPAWKVAAENLLQRLNSVSLGCITNIGVIGRCKGFKLVLGQDFVREVLHLSDGRQLQYKQLDDSFSNPNSHVNEKVLDWICKVVRSKTLAAEYESKLSSIHITLEHSDGTFNQYSSLSSMMQSYKNTDTEIVKLQTKDEKAVNECSTVESTEEMITDATYCSLNEDLLELYCGNGNHTVALAGYFRAVVAVELNKSLCAAANENLKSNGIANAFVVPCDSEKFAFRILRDKQFILHYTTNSTIPKDSSVSACSIVNQQSTAPPTRDGAVNDTMSCDAKQQQTSLIIDTNQLPAGFANEKIPTLHCSDASTSSSNTSETDHNNGSTGNFKVSGNNKNDDFTGGKSLVFQFGTVLVDPPRSGLDAQTRRLIAQYDRIIYISCCPDALVRDLKELCLTHKVVQLGVFDQFAYTPHVESGVYLIKITSI